jgi:hypothetical protein
VGATGHTGTLGNRPGAGCGRLPQGRPPQVVLPRVCRPRPLGPRLLPPPSPTCTGHRSLAVLVPSRAVMWGGGSRRGRGGRLGRRGDRPAMSPMVMAADAWPYRRRHRRCRRRSQATAAPPRPQRRAELHSRFQSRSRFRFWWARACPALWQPHAERPLNEAKRPLRLHGRQFTKPASILVSTRRLMDLGLGRPKSCRFRRQCWSWPVFLWWEDPPTDVVTRRSELPPAMGVGSVVDPNHGDHVYGVCC